MLFVLIRRRRSKQVKTLPTKIDEKKISFKKLWKSLRSMKCVQVGKILMFGKQMNAWRVKRFLIVFLTLPRLLSLSLYLSHSLILPNFWISFSNISAAAVVSRRGRECGEKRWVVVVVGVWEGCQNGWQKLYRNTKKAVWGQEIEKNIRMSEPNNRFALFLSHARFSPKDIFSMLLLLCERTQIDTYNEDERFSCLYSKVASSSLLKDLFSSCCRRRYHFKRKSLGKKYNSFRFTAPRRCLQTSCENIRHSTFALLHILL